MLVQYGRDLETVPGWKLFKGRVLLYALALLLRSREAMEVELSVKPQEIRRHELLVREAARILRKSNTEPIKTSWLEWEDNQMCERFISPFARMQLEIQEVKEFTGVTLHNIEHEFTYSDGLSLTRRPPEYWDRLGSSKNRTQLQKEESKKLVSEMIDECGLDTVVVFTDGSCQPNPGSCGAGACIYIPHQTEPDKLSRPVSGCGSILLGWLVAIHMWLEYLQREITNLHGSAKCLLMSDSQSAVGILSLGLGKRRPQANCSRYSGSKTTAPHEWPNFYIKWTPGHAEIKGNEIADKLAKQASTLAAEMATDISVVSVSY